MQVTGNFPLIGKLKHNLYSDADMVKLVDT